MQKSKLILLSQFSRFFLLIFIVSLLAVAGCNKDDSVDVTGSEEAAELDDDALNDDDEEYCHRYYAGAQLHNSGDYGERSFDYVDVREDRVLIYAPIYEDGTTFRYTARVVSRGEFVIPPVYASAMYDPVYRGNSEGGKMVATEE